MKVGIYAVHDAAVGAFLQPFVARSDAEAVRMFGFAVADAETILNKSPEHFVLYHVGSFDDQKALLEPVVPIRFCSKATEWVVLDAPEKVVISAPNSLERESA